MYFLSTVIFLFIHNLKQDVLFEIVFLFLFCFCFCLFVFIFNQDSLTSQLPWRHLWQVITTDPDSYIFLIPIYMYSEIPLLRPPKIKTSYLLKTLFAKFKLFFSSFSKSSVPLIRDNLWDCPKVVLKITFGQSQRWS